MEKWLDVGEFVVQIASGAQHIIFLTNMGKLLGLGNNKDGQLGVSLPDYATHTNDIIVIPTDFLKKDSQNHMEDEAEKIIKIACGNHHTCVLTDYGRLFGCGK